MRSSHRFFKNRTAVCLILICFLLLPLFFGCAEEKDNNSEIKIVSTIFPGYDFARAVTENTDNTDVRMLLPPGSESHDYEPSLSDIDLIKNSDLFITVGGDTDKWVSALPEGTLDGTSVIKMTQCVETYEEEITEGMKAEEEDEGPEEDEHVWTSLSNAEAITGEISSVLSSLFPQYADEFASSCDEYVSRLEKLREEYLTVSENAERNILLFADRFPFRYLAEELSLECYAAFPGCSSNSEPTLDTIYFLKNKAEEYHVPVILKTESCTSSAADVIAEETGARVMVLHSAHNVSKADFDSGRTYYDIMEYNCDVLKEALN